MLALNYPTHSGDRVSLTGSVYSLGVGSELPFSLGVGSELPYHSLGVGSELPSSLGVGSEPPTLTAGPECPSQCCKMKRLASL